MRRKRKIEWTIVALLAISLGGLLFFNRDVISKSMHSKDYAQHFVAGTYEEYSPEKLTEAKDRKIILYFSAPWCPTCSAFEEEMSKAATTLPADILLLRVDYDTHVDMRQKYKIPFQHSFVVLDHDGNEVNHWSGGGVERLKRELQSN